MVGINIPFFFIFSFIFLFASACAPSLNQNGKNIYTFFPSYSETEDERMLLSKAGQNDLSKKLKEEKKKEKGIVEKGIVEYVLPSQNKIKANARKGNISLHFDKINVDSFLKYLAYEVLKFSYVAPTDLKGSISIHAENLSEEEILLILKEVLNSFGYNVIINYDRRLIKVLKGTKPHNLSDLSLLVYKLKYTSPTEIKSLLQALNIKEISFSVIGKRKIVIISDKENVKFIRQYLDYIDNLFAHEKNIAFIKTSLNPQKVKEYVEKILGLLGISPNIKLIESLEDINMLVVITEDKTLLQEVKRWVRIIESSKTASKERIYILKLNYLNAEEVKTFLQQLDIFNNLPVQSNYNYSDLSITQVSNNEGTRIQETNKKDSSKEKREKSIIEEKNKHTFNKEKEIKGIRSKIVADVSTNTLIIKATPLQYKIIESIVKRLDKQPLQAFIEMVVAEISLGDSLNYGLETLFKGFINEYSFTIETNFGLRPSSETLQGFKAIIFGKNTDIRGILNFLSSKTKLKVLSAPYILVKSGEEAKIEVGAEVPIITELMTTTSGGIPVVTTAIQYRATGIILKVKPIISQDGSITLKIEEEVSDAIPNTLSPDVQSPIITKRSATTTLVLKEGQVALLGGILQRRYEENQKEIPLLGDIPGLGYFFKSKEKKSSKTELIILLKVHVVRNFAELSTYRDEVMEKLQNIKEILKIMKRKKNDEKRF